MSRDCRSLVCAPNLAAHIPQRPAVVSLSGSGSLCACHASPLAGAAAVLSSALSTTTTTTTTISAFRP